MANYTRNNVTILLKYLLLLGLCARALAADCFSDGSILELVELRIDAGATADSGASKTVFRFLPLRVGIQNKLDKEVHLRKFMLVPAFGFHGKLKDTNGLQWEFTTPPPGFHVSWRRDHFKEFITFPPKKVKYVDVSVIVGEIPLSPINRQALKEQYLSARPGELDFSLFAPVYLVDPAKPEEDAPAVISGSCTATIDWRMNTKVTPARTYERPKR